MAELTEQISPEEMASMIKHLNEQLAFFRALSFWGAYLMNQEGFFIKTPHDRIKEIRRTFNALHPEYGEILGDIED